MALGQSEGAMDEVESQNDLSETGLTNAPKPSKN